MLWARRTCKRWRRSWRHASVDVMPPVAIAKHWIYVYFGQLKVLFDEFG